MKSDKKVTKFVTLPNSKFPGLYEFVGEVFEVPRKDDPSNITCLCCKKTMIPVFDIQQLGFWQDHFNTFFLCAECLKVTKFTYDLSRIAKAGRDRKSKKDGKK